MKNIGTLLLVVLILLAALAVYLLLGPLGEKPGMRSVEGTAESGKGSSSPANALPRRAPAGGNAASAVSPGQSATEASSEAGTTAAAVVEPAGAGRTARNFPTAADIPVGMGKSGLQDAYGKPNMVTTVVDQGRLIETFVYLRREPNMATVVLMRNGRVAAANSTVY